MVFYNKDGIFKKYTFAAICPNPAKSNNGPIGDFWRIWYSELKQEDKFFKLVTTDTHTFEIEMATGKILKKTKNK